MGDTPYYFSFGEGDEHWAAPNPRNAGSAAQAAAYDYLVRICPDTETAIAQLRAIRAKVREEGRRRT